MCKGQEKNSIGKAKVVMQMKIMIEMEKSTRQLQNVGECEMK